MSKPAERDKPLKRVKCNKSDGSGLLLTRPSTIYLKNCLFLSLLSRNPCVLRCARATRLQGRAGHGKGLTFSGAAQTLLIAHHLISLPISAHMGMCKPLWCTRMPFSSPKMCHSPPLSVLNHAQKQREERDKDFEEVNTFKAHFSTFTEAFSTVCLFQNCISLLLPSTSFKVWVDKNFQSPVYISRWTEDTENCCWFCSFTTLSAFLLNRNYQFQCGSVGMSPGANPGDEERAGEMTERIGFVGEVPLRSLQERWGQTF